VDLQNKLNSLQRNLKGLGRVVVAFSGGVDSTFLLKVAADTLGADSVLACIATGPALPQSQYKQAVDLAGKIGVTLEEVHPNELADTKYARNKADRCFHCKAHLYQIITDLARQRGFDTVICGHNLDDADDYRPGNRAAKEFGIGAPLAEAKMTKADIRSLSRQFDLPTADMPASPCLASRLSYGLQITTDRLKQIEQAEDFLRSRGFVEFRVRHHDTIARIEVKPADFARLLAPYERNDIVKKLKSLGFKYVSLDLQGFRSGSLNETLTQEDKEQNL